MVHAKDEKNIIVFNVIIFHGVVYASAEKLGICNKLKMLRETEEPPKPIGKYLIRCYRNDDGLFFKMEIKKISLLSLQESLDCLTPIIRTIFLTVEWQRDEQEEIV